MTAVHDSAHTISGPTGHLKNLYAFREMLIMWTLREIKVRYRQSVLGAAWAVLQPLGMMVVFAAVFSYLTRIPTDGLPYPLFSYIGLLPWTFVATSIAFAAPSMINSINLISKIYFPREILPIATVITAFVDFFIASLVFVAMLVYYQVAPTMQILWLPALLAIQIALTLGIVLFLSALSVKYRDIRFVVPLAVQMWMFASPVVYPSSLVPAHLLKFYNLNPMVGLIDGYRSVVIMGRAPDQSALIASAAISVLVALAGYYYFKTSESIFADII